MGLEGRRAREEREWREYFERIVAQRKPAAANKMPPGEAEKPELRKQEPIEDGKSNKDGSA